MGNVSLDSVARAEPLGTRAPLSTADRGRDIARAGERVVAQRLMALGFTVESTRYHEHYDLLVNGRVRVEVKTGLWRGVRYQARMRSNDADVCILVCARTERTRDWKNFFVIPFELVSGLSYFKICQANPADYKGKFSQYLDRWEIVGQMVDGTYQHID